MIEDPVVDDPVSTGDVDTPSVPPVCIISVLSGMTGMIAIAHDDTLPVSIAIGIYDTIILLL